MPQGKSSYGRDITFHAIARFSVPDILVSYTVLQTDGEVIARLVRRVVITDNQLMDKTNPSGLKRRHCGFGGGIERD